MNYTQNHHLPQWEKDDRIMMEDFNRMCRDMEAGLDAGLDGTAQAEARVQAGVNRAEAAAARAQAKADAAYSPDQPPYVVGSYQGTYDTIHISLGFRPRFVIISGGVTDYNFILAGQHTSTPDNLEITDDGFTVKRHMINVGTEGEGERPPFLSHGTTSYSYIAFR